MEVEKQIAEELAKQDGFFDSRGWDYQPESVQEVYSNKAKQILSIIEKAGKASGRLLSDEEIENERLTYLQEGDDTIDEAVLYNATIHLECLSETAYMLIMHNARHYWHFSIFSKGGKAHQKVRLLEDRSRML